MANTRTFQKAFAGGEISPEMFGRIDDPRYQNGAAMVRNMMISPQGPARNRPGLEYVATTKNSGVVRLIEFTYSTDQTVVVELGAGYFRFHQDGATIPFTEPTVPAPPAYIASRLVTVAFPDTTGILTTGAAHLLQDNDLVEFTGTISLTVGHHYYAIDTQSVSTEFKVSLTPGGAAITGIIVAGATFHRAYQVGDLTNWSGPSPGTYQCRRSNPQSVTPPFAMFWTALTDAATYEIPNFYAAADLFDITYTQSHDVLTLAHPNYPKSELRRYGASKWTHEIIPTGSQVDAPTGLVHTHNDGAYFTIGSLQDGGNNLRVRLSINAKANGFVAGSYVYLYTENTYFTAGGPTDYLRGEFIISDDDPGDDRDFEVSYVGGGAVVQYTLLTNAGSPGNAFVKQISVLNDDTTQSYVVTAFDRFGVESLPSAAVSAASYLFVAGSSNTIYWNASSEAQRYHVYKKVSGLYGYIGQVAADETLEFLDDNISPDLGVSPPFNDNELASPTSAVTFDIADDRVDWTAHGLVDGDRVFFETTDTLPGNAPVAGTTYYVVNATTNDFQISLTYGGVRQDMTGGASGTHYATGGDFPGAVGYFEQRRVFAGTTRRPQSLWATRSGTESDLSYSLPIKDADRIYFKIASRQASTIRHVVPLDHLILLTSAGEYRVSPLNSDAITPSSVSVRPQSYVGSSTVSPVVVNNTLVFCAARGGHLREMGYNAASSGFVTGDLSLRAAHLFDDYSIVQLAYAKAPTPIVWAVSSSGDLLSLTYVPEERVGAWSHHDTDGTFESCCVVSEGDEDILYVVVKRTVNDSTVRYIERMAPQAVGNLEDAFFVDSGLTYDSTPATTITGLTHLVGKTVAILADGVVQAQQVVSATGTITLATAASTVQVGLPYTAQLQTLPLLAQIEGFGQGRMVNINRAWLRVFETGTFQVGPSATALSPVTLSSLTSAEQRVTLDPSWTRDGQIMVQQTAPLPLTVVGLTLEASIGG